MAVRGTALPEVIRKMGGGGRDWRILRTIYERGEGEDNIL